MDYDEDTVLTRYVWDHCQHLMTDFERRIGTAVLIRLKSDVYNDANPLADANDWLKEHGLDDDAAREAIAHPQQFRARVRDRLLAECADDVFINRCTECRKVVATPEARQCLWCGHDWH